MLMLYIHQTVFLLHIFIIRPGYVLHFHIGPLVKK